MRDNIEQVGFCATDGLAVDILLGSNVVHQSVHLIFHHGRASNCPGKVQAYCICLLDKVDTYTEGADGMEMGTGTQ